MSALLRLFDGKKTYLMSLALAAYAGLGLMTGQLSPTAAIELLLGSGALSSLRHAIGKLQPTLTIIIDLLRRMSP